MEAVYVTMFSMLELKTGGVEIHLTLKELNTAFAFRDVLNVACSAVNNTNVSLW